MRLILTKRYETKIENFCKYIRPKLKKKHKIKLSAKQKIYNQISTLTFFFYIHINKTRWSGLLTTCPTETHSCDIYVYSNS